MHVPLKFLKTLLFLQTTWTRPAEDSPASVDCCSSLSFFFSFSSFSLFFFFLGTLPHEELLQLVILSEHFYCILFSFHPYARQYKMSVPTTCVWQQGNTPSYCPFGACHPSHKRHKWVQVEEKPPLQGPSTPLSADTNIFLDCHEGKSRLDILFSTPSLEYLPVFWPANGPVRILQSTSKCRRLVGS